MTTYAIQVLAWTAFFAFSLAIFAFIDEWWQSRHPRRRRTYRSGR